MTVPPVRNSHDAVERFLLINDPDASPEQILSALQWIEADMANASAIEQVSRFWHAADDVPLSRISRPGSTVWRALTNRSVQAIAACLIACVVVSLFFFELGNPASRGAIEQERFSFASGVGQTKNIVLPDGSQVQLGGRTHISVSYDRHARRVSLTGGEALFAVRDDGDRLFRVESGNGSVSAQAGSFNVRRLTRETVVTVVDGNARIDSVFGQSVLRKEIGKGYQTSFFDTGDVTPIRRVSISDIIAWKHGIVHYDDVPLAIIVEDLNRYSKKRIILSSPRLNYLRFSGVVRYDNLGDWLRGVGRLVGVNIVEDGRFIHLGVSTAGSVI
ncbi:FecR domain-containing protein [Sphingomonadaceae bacterium G21617-S1]|nr:FecR domain-containing protein [Sphingomonadaceae bacterium G21617-S1]